MKFFKFLISRAFWVNILIFLAIVVVIFISIQFFMSKFTHHGESLTVPDFKGYTVQQLDEICNERGLRYSISDSIYKAGVPYFTVVEQSPKAHSKVKHNRRIYFTISSDKPPKVKLPNLRDVSLRQALVIIESAGLKVGELEYVPDIAQNVVLRVTKDGRELKQGSFIKKGSEINLVLGDGLSSQKRRVPDLREMPIDEAVFALKGFGFNIGAIIYDEDVKDSSEAIIYKQNPLPNPDEKLAQGEAIDIWLTTISKIEKMNIKNNNKDFQDSLKKAMENEKIIIE